MLEAPNESWPKNKKPQENPTAPGPGFSCSAFADHSSSTRKSGQQNENPGPESVGLGEEKEYREEENKNKNKEGEEKTPTRRSSQDRDKGSTQTTVPLREMPFQDRGDGAARREGLRVIEGNNAAGASQLEARQPHSATLERNSVERGSRTGQQVPPGEPRVLFENLKWLNSEEAVTYLRLPSLGALRNLVYRRQIPFTKLGRTLRFDREELDRFLSSLTRHRRVSI